MQANKYKNGRYLICGIRKNQRNTWSQLVIPSERFFTRQSCRTKTTGTGKDEKIKHKRKKHLRATDAFSIHFYQKNQPKGNANTTYKPKDLKYDNRKIRKCNSISKYKG